MRLLIAFLISLISIITVAQTSNHQYTIEWKQPVPIYGGGKSMSFTGALLQNTLP